MSFNKRRIINHATEWAKNDAKDHRDTFVQSLDSLRKEVDLKTKDIDEILDMPDNWYSNRLRGGNGSHEFMLNDFELCKEFIQEYQKTEDVDIENLRIRANLSTHKKLQRLEEMREFVDIDENKIDRAIDKPKNWYLDCINGNKNMSLNSYFETFIFLESLLMVYVKEGYINDNVVDNLVDQGYIDQEVVPA